MKRNGYLLILVLSCFVFGCGASGGSTTSGVPGDGGSGGNGGDVLPSGPVGTISVTFPGSPAPRAATYSTLINPGNYGVEGGFRVTASRYESREVFNGYIEGPIDPVTGEPTLIETYRTVYTRVYFNSGDNVVPGSVLLKVPVYNGPNGYLIEVMSFSDNILKPSFDNVNDPSSTQMRRYGYLDNVQIFGGENITRVDVTLNPIAHNTVQFTYPDTITGETEYSMLVSYNGIRVPLRNTFNFLDNNSNNFVFPSNVMDNAALTYTVGRPFTRIAPAGASGDNIYFQGQFYIYDSMLSDFEQGARLWKKYRLNVPNDLSNPISEVLNQPGTINIGIN